MVWTSAKTDACYTSLIGATVLSEVRTISGFLRIAAKAFSKQYCLSDAEWNEVARVVLRGQAEKQEPQNYL